MAPTEILARQHFATIAPLAARAGVSVAVLTGREKGRERAEMLTALAAGDDRHRWSARTRCSRRRSLPRPGARGRRRAAPLRRPPAPRARPPRARAVDMLVMTATPIPRTLVLTAFGDMDVSALDREAGRAASRSTRVTVPLARIDEVVGAARRAIADGAQGLLDLPAGGGIGDGRPDVGRGAARGACASASGPRSAWSTAG